MAEKTYVVATPLVIARRTSGPAQYVWTGGALPTDTDPEQLKMLIAEGQVVEGDFEGGLPREPDLGIAAPAPAVSGVEEHAASTRKR